MQDSAYIMTIIEVQFAKVVVTTYMVKCADCGYVFKHMETIPYAHCASCNNKCRTQDLKFNLGNDK